MSKIRLLFFFFIICFFLILAKLVYLQVIARDLFSADYIATQKISPVRGKIFDRHLQPLAVNQSSYLLYVEPPKIQDKSYLARKLDEVLKIGEATIEARINDKKQWAAIKDGLTDEQKAALEKEKLKGIGFQNQQIRFYPEASLAAHLVGFVGKNDTGSSVGYFGIEGYYDKDLAGLAGVIKSERDLIGRPIFVGTQDFVAAEDGRDLVLTIDKTVQHIIKDALRRGMDLYKPKQGCVIVTYPATAEILGLTCLPDYDPDTYYDYSEKTFNDWAISDLYEPGSTFKPLVMAAALEEKKVKPSDLFDEKGGVEISGYTIQNWNDKYEGKISISRILEKSSNVGMVYVGNKLGNERLYQYLGKYGLGGSTEIDLQGEAVSYLKPIKDWYPIDFSAAAFGQGIAMTPLQLIRAFGAVVNGGYLMKPYTVKAIIDGGEEKQRDPKPVRRVISEQTSATMRQMLVSTVEHAEAKWDRPEGYKIGGKTGTAQLAIGGKYDASKTIASFVGFAPADNPVFLVLVVLREPATSGWGSETAAPIFFEIAKQLFVYYNIPPQE